MKAFRKASPLVAAALAAAFGSLAAAQDEPSVEQLKTPDSEVSVGAGYVGDDNQRFGQYSGLNEKGGTLLLDADVVKRYDASGTWLRLRGRNVGLDSRELRFEHERQGNWGYYIDYSQIPRFDPFTVNTGLQGIGTTTQTQSLITPGAGTDHHLEMERKRWTFGGRKTLAPGLSAQVVFRNEDKDGARLWGQGTFGSWRFLTDPIDQTTRQIDATLSYNAGKLQLVGGYYGTRFENRNSVVNTSALAPLGAPPFNPMALPPDNQSHQFHVSGGYSFTPTTRGMFKVALGRITQNETFPVPPVAGAPGSLDARVDTTLVQGGLTARPLPKLSLRADLRYENRDDKTPVFLYFPNQVSATSTNNGQNEPRDIKTKAAKLDGAYQLPAQFKLNAGIDYVEKKRNSPPVRSVSFREETDETTLSVGLRRAIGEKATGSVTLLHGKRTGSDFLVNVFNGGAVYSNAIAPLHLADRDRDTIRAVLNWMPTEPLSLNFRADFSKDQYKGRTTTGFELGPRKGQAQLFSVDAAYSFSERLQATAWASRNVNKYENATCRESGAPLNCTPADPANPVWGSKLDNTDNSFGLGLLAKASTALKLGADLVYSRVHDDMQIVFITPASAANVAGSVLPDITTKVTTLKVYGDYALRKNTGVRVQWIRDQYKTDDWTWANWVYSDGTTVKQDPNQTVNFLGAAVYLRF